MKSNLPEYAMTERDRLNLAIMIAEVNGNSGLADALRDLLVRHENHVLAVALLPELTRPE